MSRPGAELFPEASSNNINTYSSTDVNMGHAVDDPLNTGVNQQIPDAADQGQQVSDKDYNFRALTDVVTTLKSEREYWKGQAEAYARTVQPQTQQQPETSPSEALNSIDWDDSGAVKTAFEHVFEDNRRLRSEVRDSLAAVQAKAQHQDWNNMVTQNVPELTTKNPIFAEMIRNASNPYEAAYLLAELNSRASNQVPQQQPGNHPNAQRVLENSRKPQTLASVGGLGKLNQADYYANMSDEDFMKVAAKNMANI